MTSHVHGPADEEDRMADPPAERVVQRRRPITAVDGLVVVGVLMLLALAPLARLTVDDQRRPPIDLVRLSPLPPHARNGSLRDLPIGVPTGFIIRTPKAVAAIAEQALGPDASRALLKLLEPSASELSDTVVRDHGYIKYPFHYPALDAILAGPADGWATNRTALGAALTQLAVARPSDGSFSRPYSNAGPAAFAILDRARVRDECAPQLDLLLLLAADISSINDDVERTEAVVRAEAARASRACPADPTPGWVLGQYLSQSEYQWKPSERVHAVAVFAELIKEFPGSTAVITGAADAELRTALRSADSAPFRARNSFRAAQHGYERAAALGAKDESAPGLARALIGLGEPAQAAKILRGRIADSSTPGPLLELLVVAEEAAHDFGRAESDARRLAGLGSRAFPDGPALYPVGSFPLGSAPPTPPTPLSVGADRFAPLTVRFHGRGLGGGSVEDLSFIPTYRSVRSVTGSEPECGDWTWRRDAVLAGHAREALTGWPTSTQETALNRACFSASSYGFSGASDYATFYALVQAEAGIRAPMGRYVAKQLADDRQNLWRWAGDMRKAERVIRAWIKADPNDPLAELRLGEVEYLQRRYDAAAAHFGTAARRTRDADWRNDLGVDEALLDRGAALRAAGRAAEATAVLRDVESDAARDFPTTASTRTASPPSSTTHAYRWLIRNANLEHCTTPSRTTLRRRKCYGPWRTLLASGQRRSITTVPSPTWG
jgi:cellulose synthase operon protein C